MMTVQVGLQATMEKDPVVMDGMIAHAGTLASMRLQLQLYGGVPTAHGRLHTAGAICTGLATSKVDFAQSSKL
jgi:hypothetical protein